MRPKRVLITAGGTGGHVFPALATAYELSLMGLEVFFITDVRGEKYLENKSFGYQVVNSAGYGQGVNNKVKFAQKNSLGIFQSMSVMRKFKPDIAIGFGGYPSFPAIVAAKVSGVKIILHEQNSVLGKTNKFLMKYANTIAASFKNTKYVGNTVLVGNPVRDEIKFNEYHKEFEHLKVLIIGGSQGAKIFSDILPQAFEGLRNVSVTQQVVQDDVEITKLRYREMNIEAEIKSFFDDMDRRLSEAHLIISRAGSSSIFEIAAVGRPTIFIPLPHSADNHQYLNAKAVIEEDGGWLVEEKDITKDEFSNLIREVLSNPMNLAEKAVNIRKLAKPDAAKDLAKLIVENI